MFGEFFLVGVFLGVVSTVFCVCFVCFVAHAVCFVSLLLVLLAIDFLVSLLLIYLYVWSSFMS